MRSKLQRIVAKTPEVMVKITGKSKTVAHLKSHLEYITRKGELAAETETGAVMDGRQGLRDIQVQWADDAALDQRRRRNGPLSHNIVLSMPPGTDPIAVKDAVRAFAMETFGGAHDYVSVLHLDDKHPHVHLTVRSLGYNGRRLNPRKADLATWREDFAGELRLRGVEAEATPRRARGKIRKAERGVVRSIRERGEPPRVERLAREEIIREARGGRISPRPWEKKTRDRQTAIRDAYRIESQELERSSNPSDHELSQQLWRFVSEMLRPETRRDHLKRELFDRLMRRGARAPSKGKERGDADDR
ncbi:relaxase/mobilization nuclease domain-containing protein [Methylocystis sp.]|uniref:relaxase/mobilization nuclease domain-containing protein n=1 Tax=Methylocystis sp. TaxID=1911079 RepID=UPI003D0BD5E9